MLSLSLFVGPRCEVASNAHVKSMWLMLSSLMCSNTRPPPLPPRAGALSTFSMFTRSTAGLSRHILE